VEKRPKWHRLYEANPPIHEIVLGDDIEEAEEEEEEGISDVVTQSSLFHLIFGGKEEEEDKKSKKGKKKPERKSVTQRKAEETSYLVLDDFSAHLGEVLISFQLIPKAEISDYPLVKSIMPVMVDCFLEMSLVGLRDMLPFFLVPLRRTWCLIVETGITEVCRARRTVRPREQIQIFWRIFYFLFVFLWIRFSRRRSISAYMTIGR